jgi:hypothetical protein
LKDEPENLMIGQVFESAIYILNNFTKYEEQKVDKEILFNLIQDYLYVKHEKTLKNSIINLALNLIDPTDFRQISHFFHLLKRGKEKNSLLRGDSEIFDDFSSIKLLDLKGLDDVKF